MKGKKEKEGSHVAPGLQGYERYFFIVLVIAVLFIAYIVVGLSFTSNSLSVVLY